MYFDVGARDPKDIYKLLSAAIVPRPIAWIVTQNIDGRSNAAPFSFFNAMSGEPPLVAIGMGCRGDRPKDTPSNIHRTGEFVVNLVSEELVEKMNVTAAEFDYGVDELAEAGIATVASTKISPPRISDCPVALECERMVALDVGIEAAIIIGRVVAIHVRPDVVINAEKCHLDSSKMRLVSRMGGGNAYGRTRDVFQLKRLSVEDWRTREKSSNA